MPLSQSLPGAMMPLHSCSGTVWGTAADANCHVGIGVVPAFLYRPVLIAIADRLSGAARPKTAKDPPINQKIAFAVSGCVIALESPVNQDDNTPAPTNSSVLLSPAPSYPADCPRWVQRLLPPPPLRCARNALHYGERGPPMDYLDNPLFPKRRLMLFLGSPVLHNECIANGETVNGQSATHQGL
jgi:hypothetical protein